MSTPHPTTERTTSSQPAPTLTDGRWRAANAPATSEATRRVQRQFAPDRDTRLHNLVDEENRATLG